jgi:autotransporter adhesin
MASNGGAAFGDFAAATGGTATVSSATAIGNSASATTPNAVAVGQSANVLATNGTAIGGGATVQSGATNSVAIGQGSVATTPNSVSFGTPGSPRVLSNVAPGVAPGDVATFGQLSSMATGIQTQIGGIQSQIGGLQSQISNNLTESRRGIAAAVATANAPMPSAPGRLSYQIRGSTYEGQGGFGLSLAYRLNTTVPLAVVGGYGNGGGVENTGYVGLQGEF